MLDQYKSAFQIESLQDFAVVASAVAQEMNNPLSILSANCSYLEHHCRDLVLHEVVRENRDQIERLSHLVISLIDLARQRNEDSWIDISLQSLLSSVEMMINPVVKQLNFSKNHWIKFINDVPKQGLPRVRVEPNQMKLLLVRLLTSLFSTVDRVTDPVIQLTAEFLLDTEQVVLTISTNGYSLADDALQEMLSQARVNISIDQHSSDIENKILVFLPVRVDSSSHIAIIDSDCMLGLTRIVRDQLSDLVVNLRHELDHLKQEMMQSLTQKEWRNLVVQVHGVKGISRSVCAYRLGQYSAELEFLLRQETIDEVLFNEQFSHFLDVIDITSTAFNRYLVEQKA